MPSDRWAGIIVVVVGVGLVVFRRAAARHQAEHDRNYYSSPFGHGLMIVASYLGPAGWIVFGGLAFLDRLSPTGAPEQVLPAIGLKEGQLAGLGFFIGGVLLLAFRGRWLRLHERMIAWQCTQAGQTFLSRCLLVFSLVVAAAGLPWMAGIVL